MSARLTAAGWLLLAHLALLQAGCAEAGGKTRNDAERSAAVPVTVASPQRISIQRRVELTGTLVSPDEAEISSEVAGVVDHVAVELGQEVSRGDVLVTLDRRELGFALEQAVGALHHTEAQLGIDVDSGGEPPNDEEVASVQAATANVEDARAKLARAEQLAARGLLPLAERESTETRLRVAMASLKTAVETVRSLKATLSERRAAVALAKKRLEDAVIRAPVDGAVTARLARRGVLIKENTPVVTLTRLDPLRLEASVQERFADVIRAGMPVQFQVEPFPGAVFEARVAHMNPSVDRATRTFEIEATVVNADRRLKPGFFTKGVILTRVDDSVLAIPEQAVSTLSGLSSVFVVDKEVVRQLQVVLGERQGSLFEIVEGLTGSERLAASNLNRLATGVTVSSDRPHAAASHGDAAGRNQR